ncbi:MAG: PD-(D/E)XK nuclease family protein [Thermodesulfobacteriota bacterium]
MAHPFSIVDWGNDFPAALAGLLPEGADLARTLVVFPHQRPRRYLCLALRERAGGLPLLAPEIATVGELVPALRRRLEGRVLAQASDLDQAGLLAEIVADLGAAAGPLAALPPERFFPWGLRLAGLLEELAAHNLAPANLAGLEGQVEDAAADILVRLSRLAAALDARLEELDLTTPGRDAAWAARNADAACAALAGRQVVLAGFHALTGSEDALFRALWRCGAQVVLHTDSRLAEDGAEAHWSCAEHARWLANWRARAETAVPAPPDRDRRIRFHEGYDLHSQLGLLPELLGTPAQGPTAVVLPDTGLLMPVLHHLPVKEVNVSMGYPLARSNLARLVECLCALQENAREPERGGGYLWRDLAALVRHPYLRMLPAGGGRTLRSVFKVLEERLRTGLTYADPRDLPLEDEDLPEGVDPDLARSALARTWEVCLDRFARAETLAGLGEALLDLARLLAPEESPEGEERHGPWHRFPVDAECLCRLTRAVAPALLESRASATPLGREMLFTVLRQLLARERAPFEAEPLTGVQVLGMLETRLLAFDRVVVLDATEDALPGPPARDPLLPDPLRRDLGLPDGRQRSRVAAHTFFALLAAGRDIRLLTQRGAVSKGPLSGKSVRSRFLEELLWEEEQRRGALVKAGDPFLGTVPLRVSAPAPPQPGLAKTPAVADRLSRMLATQAFSATRLDAYLNCPLQFFHRYLTPLREVEAVSEDGDPAELGSLAHDVLAGALRPFLGRDIGPGTLDPEALAAAFASRLEGAAFHRNMPWRRRQALRRVGMERMRRFAGALVPGQLLALETDCSSHLAGGAGGRSLHGRLDRVDRRDDGCWVLDYKTGGPRKPAMGFWSNQALWERMEAWTPAGGDDALLPDLAAAVQSVQLPLYLHLWSSDRGEVPANAAAVELRLSGAESPLFSDKAPEGLAERVATDLAPRLAAFLLRHLEESETFAARTGPHCTWCAYGYACPAPEKPRR